MQFINALVNFHNLRMAILGWQFHQQKYKIKLRNMVVVKDSTFKSLCQYLSHMENVRVSSVFRMKLLCGFRIGGNFHTVCR